MSKTSPQWSCQDNKTKRKGLTFRSQTQEEARCEHHPNTVPPNLSTSSSALGKNDPKEVPSVRLELWCYLQKKLCCAQELHFCLKKIRHSYQVCFKLNCCRRTQGWDGGMACSEQRALEMTSSKELQPFQLVAFFLCIWFLES